MGGGWVSSGGWLGHGDRCGVRGGAGEMEWVW